MDASCKIQGSIHVFRLVNNMCPGKWVHISDHGACYLHTFKVTQRVYSSVTLARCAALPYGESLFSPTSRRMLNQRVLMYGS